jgi:hypothetical protein
MIVGILLATMLLFGIFGTLVGVTSKTAFVAFTGLGLLAGALCGMVVAIIPALVIKWLIALVLTIGFPVVGLIFGVALED